MNICDFTTFLIQTLGSMHEEYMENSMKALSR